MTTTTQQKQAAQVQVDTPRVRVEDVSKAFEGGDGTQVLALDHINLTVAAGEFVTVLGASGCGKSTLLNLIAGLDQPTSGRIEIAGGKQAALMFQESALFPWLTAAGNIDLALKLGGTPRGERAHRRQELLDLVRLGGAGDRRVHELSGGQRQRIALARSLAQGADVLLMDEPFAALDAITRDVLHEELSQLWSSSGMTVIFVTHNVREAVRLGQRVVLLSSRPGRVLKTWDIELSQPRNIEDPAVGALSTEITLALREEIVRHVNR
ncbi:NitT/TauT family transport system ATP-binding protein [Branchiibius hedensis]|uniref:NitT/TauT family transport system ATP-binding protein n=1 Tax=Branchiibius hedensis TaxID=672460 RepID=A0A2Y8ZWE0_9MICO|nr:ABC transporter ATP-binding protein [Branchiibius hedensis]PWJ25776.1 NitT/TauT family transport system ATP-binding protein [Branchiibius hedensis]SSA34589.1 NitT/TauT family transport system ATP-binding protein [Branchiibius hedensis]